MESMASALYLLTILCNLIFPFHISCYHGFTASTGLSILRGCLVSILDHQLGDMGPDAKLIEDE